MKNLTHYKHVYFLPAFFLTCVVLGSSFIGTNQSKEKNDHPVILAPIQPKLENIMRGKKQKHCDVKIDVGYEVTVTENNLPGTSLSTAMFQTIGRHGQIQSSVTVPIGSPMFAQGTIFKFKPSELKNGMKSNNGIATFNIVDPTARNTVSFLHTVTVRDANGNTIQKTTQLPTIGVKGLSNVTFEMVLSPSMKDFFRDP